jgi:hypothetical protein
VIPVAATIRKERHTITLVPDVSAVDDRCECSRIETRELTWTRAECHCIGYGDWRTAGILPLCIERELTGPGLIGKTGRRDLDRGQKRRKLVSADKYG